LRINRPMKVLFISYFSPPSGGVPIRRLIPMLKYLPEYGVDAIILTCQSPRYYALDTEEKIPDKVTVYRAPELLATTRKEGGGIIRDHYKIRRNHIFSSLRFLYNLIRYPDPQWLWIPKAIELGEEIIEKENPDVILATQPPTTNLLIGYALSISTGKPLILDYRDFWASKPYIERNNPLHLLIDRVMEKRVIDEASSIWCVTVPMLVEMKKRFPAHRDKMFYIPNGYDEDDFKNIKRERYGDNSIILIHTGPITPVRSPEMFLNALREVSEELKGEKTIEFHQFGYVHPSFNNLFKDMKDLVFLHQQMSHREVIQEMVNADVGVCIAGVFSSDRVGFPQKAYEYLRAGIPVLAIAPFNDNYRWMTRSGLGWQADPYDIESIKSVIRHAISDRRAINNDIITNFEWRRLSKLAYKLISKVKSSKSFVKNYLSL